MLESAEGCYVGTMPPESFMDRFMKVDGIPPVPHTTFSKVAPEDSPVHDMCSPFIRAVKKFKLAPGLRLFITRTKMRWNERRRSDGVLQEERMVEPDLCATMSARKEPVVRRSHKRSMNITEYYSFATSLLGIEVQRSPAADPFADAEDYESSAEYPRTPAKSPLSIKSRQLPTTPLSVSPGPLPTSFPVAPAPLVVISRVLSPQPLAESDKRHPLTSPGGSNGATRNPVEREWPEAIAFRQSLVSHAQAQLTRQHRTCFLQLILVSRWARFIRWDRSGAVVSSRFDYVFEPEILAEFIWRFAHMSDEQRGLDSTATLASKKESSLFESAVKRFIDDMNYGSEDDAPSRHLPGAEATLDSSDTYPTWRVSVVNSASGEAADLIVRRPFAGRPSLLGRATRAYIAYDLREERLVFLKDAWRVDHPKLRPEFDTYQNLKHHRVPYLPDILYGGDVLGPSGKTQQTLTQDFALVKDEWRISTSSLERFVHHRLVQDIAYPLESAAGVREFVQTIYNALCAITTAHDVAGLLHRDLSMGNVMIDARGNGLLNDWDHAGGTQNMARGIGTWRFMSIALLQNPAKVHDIVDDRESLFWVFVYGALTRFTLPDQDRLMDVFDYQTVDPKSGHRRGGQLKHDCLFGSRLLQVKFASKALQGLMSTSKKMWLMFYVGRGDLDIFDTEAKTDILNKRKQAETPSFWVDTFAKALHDLDAEDDARRPVSKLVGTLAPRSMVPNIPNITPMSSVSSSSRKRKSQGESGTRDAGDESQPSRRSKRLKTRHEPTRS